MLNFILFAFQVFFISLRLISHAFGIRTKYLLFVVLFLFSGMSYATVQSESQQELPDRIKDILRYLGDLVELRSSFDGFLEQHKFKNGEENCEMLESWKITICGENPQDLRNKSKALDHFMVQSLERKKQIPQGVREAGRAVFGIGAHNYKHNHWSWDYAGGTGFVAFDENTFVTSQALLSEIFDNISSLDELLFKNQQGEEQNFKAVGLKFASATYNVAVLEIEGYKGPVLEFAKGEDSKGQSYILGHHRGESLWTSQLKIYPAPHVFPFTDSRNEIFQEPFDCLYGYNYSGMSGGPVTNRQGQVKTIFVSRTKSMFSCPVLNSRGLDVLFLPENLQSKGISSLQEAKEYLQNDSEEMKRQAFEEGDIPALTEFVRRDIDILRVDDDYARDVINWGLEVSKYFRFIEFIDAMINDTAYDRGWAKKPSSYLTPFMWYELGTSLYYNNQDLETACKFWQKANEQAHPYIYSGFVFILKEGVDIVFCGESA